jgi:hypothetical protein
MRKFVFIVDNEVATEQEFETEGEGPKFEANRMYAAALLSNPIILEVESDNPAKVGWAWDGSNFTPPEN